MAEGESASPEQELNDIERVPSMTFWEKVGFLWFPSFWALIAAPLLLQFASYFFTFAFALLRHPQLFKQGAFWSWLAFLVANCAAFGAILVYPVRFFRKMRIRKKETGILFPGGEELVAFRYRRKHPPAWMRIWIALIFSLPAFGITYRMMVTSHRLALAEWSVAGLFWLIAIAATVDMARPRSERRWTGFVVSGAFGVLAVMAAVAIIRNGGHKAFDFFFPLLFASLSSFLAVMTVCGGRKKSAGAPRAGL
jgi:hypothetical protein